MDRYLKSVSSGRRQSGFTLVELLCVIAIVGLLAGILFPVLQRARENARRSGCMTNMKQLGLAFTQYAQDYDERLPTSADFILSPNVTWDTLLDAYMKNKQILVCRSDYVVRTNSSCTPGGLARSYSMPEASSGSGTVPLFITGLRVPATGISAYTGRNLAEVNQPAQTLLLVEHIHAYNRAGLPGDVFIRDPDEQGDQDCPVSKIEPIHFAAWNYLFADGHVKWLKPESTINGPGKTAGTITNPKGMWTVNPDD